MRIIFKAAILLVPVIMLVLPGCGSQGNTAATDPFAQSGANPVAPGSATPITTTPVTSQDPAFSLTLGTDLAAPTDISSLPQVDANIGTVLLSAELLNMSGGVFIDPVSNQPVAAGAPVPNQIVSFNVLAGPGSVVYSTPVTDKNGVAKGIFTTGNVNYTTNVIIEATTTVDGKNYRAYTSFQIVRGSGVIAMGNRGLLEAVAETIDAGVASFEVFQQQIVFKVTDSNANPRVGVPVTLSLYSQQGDADVVIDYLKNPQGELNQQTVTSDSSGTGIFNVSVTLAIPGPGLRNSDSIVFKAVTNDPIPVVAYVGGSYSITTKKPEAPEVVPVSLTASEAYFGSSSDVVLEFSGGQAPYRASSSNPNRVSVTVSGSTLIAHLEDSSSWSGFVVVSVIDAAGQSKSANLYR